MTAVARTVATVTHDETGVRMDDELGTSSAYPKFPASASPRPTGPPPSKTMATWALVLAIIPGPILWVVSIGLGIAVLRRSRDGFDHGRRRVIAAFVIIAIWVALVIVVVVAEVADDADRDASGTVTSKGDVPITEIQVGDCLTKEIEDDVELLTVEVAPCDDTHVLEAYGNFSLEDGAWPGQDQVDRLAEGGCVKRFEAFVGEPYDTSKLEVFYFRPFEIGWRRGDRGVSCLISSGGPRTGTLEHSAASPS